MLIMVHCHLHILHLLWLFSRVLLALLVEMPWCAGLSASNLGSCRAYELTFINIRVLISITHRDTAFARVFRN